MDRCKRRQLGLSGVQQLAERECTSDPDWQLVRLTLNDFATGAEVKHCCLCASLLSVCD